MTSTQGKDSFIENYCLYFESIKYIHLVRKNFFKALYLAHEIEEERDEDRWELLVSQNIFLSPIKSELDKHKILFLKPWALGKDWFEKFRSFVIAKNELWRRLGFKAMVNDEGWTFIHLFF